MTNWSVLVIVLNGCTLAFLTVWYCFQHHSKHWIQICFKCQETEKFISAALSQATGGFQTRYLLTVLNPSVSWDFSKLQTAVWVYTCSCTTNKNPIRLSWTLKRNAFRQKRPLGELKRVDYRPCFLFRFQHFCTSWLPTFFKRWSRGIYSFLSSIKALCVEDEFCQGIQSTLWYLAYRRAPKAYMPLANETRSPALH